jgi:enoyl-CoA hydratase
VAQAIATLYSFSRGNLTIGPKLTKECFRVNVDATSLQSAIAMEDRNQTLCFASPDFQEGIAAFLDKRRPRYRGT